MITSAPPADAGSPAAPRERAAPGLVAWYAEGFSDVLGDRLRLFDNATTPLELLRLAPAALAIPNAEATLRLRIDALASFRHPAFARVRSLTVLDDPRPQLAMVSELASGERLSAVLQAAKTAGVRLDATSAIWLLRHLLPALASLHEATGGLQHGWLDPERVIITPAGDLVVTEYVFGGLFDPLAPAPPGTDVCQTALLASAVLLGRPLRADERRASPADVVARACEGTPSGDVLRPWLLRAVAPPPAGFRTAREAYHALEELLPGVWGVWPAALLPGAEAPAAPASPRAIELDVYRGAARPAPPPPPTVFRALLLPGTTEPTTRRLAHVSRTLAAVAVLEALCIGFLVTQIVISDPAPAITSVPLVRTAGLVPGPSAVAPTDPAYALVPSAGQPNPAEALPAAATGSTGVTGWLALESSVEMKVYVNGRLMGYATRRRFGLPAGEHIVTFVNDDLDYRSSQSIRITAGRSVLLTPKPPVS